MFKNQHNKTLDDLNLAILRQLCLNARASNVEIGKEVGLSSPAVGERIQKMEDMGYIKGYHANPDLNKIGLTIRAFVTIKPVSTRHAEMISTISAIPEIVKWYTITGNVCILLKVVAPSSEQLEKVVMSLQPFGETTTSLILSESPDSDQAEKIFEL